MRRLLPICLGLLVASLPAAASEPAPGPVFLSPTPPDPAERQRMRVWQRAAQDRISPVLLEWERLERAARRRPGQPLTAGCRRLELALARLERRGLPPAPDPAVSLHLAQTLRALGEAARGCDQGAWFLTSWRLRQAEESWRELRGRLQLYQLAP